jgi:predicted nucleotidyltransferase
MLRLIEAHRIDIAELCRRFHVQRLDVFGSAARGSDFDPVRSDIDLLVTYIPGYHPGIAAYLDLRDALTALLERPVDLVMEGAVENPFIRAGIERSREPLYAA